MSDPVDDLAYELALAAFDFYAGPDEVWNDRMHFKVPILYYRLLAATAIDFLEKDVT
jgi:hypothetical protein